MPGAADLLGALSGRLKAPLIHSVKGNARAVTFTAARIDFARGDVVP
jgi:hypothetical protein